MHVWPCTCAAPFVTVLLCAGGSRGSGTTRAARLSRSGLTRQHPAQCVSLTSSGQPQQGTQEAPLGQPVCTLDTCAVLCASRDDMLTRFALVPAGWRQALQRPCCRAEAAANPEVPRARQLQPRGALCVAARAHHIPEEPEHLRELHGEQPARGAGQGDGRP